MNTNQHLCRKPTTASVNAYRLLALHRRHDGNEYQSSALLYRHGENIQVEWSSKNLPDIRLKPGAIVSPRISCGALPPSGVARISRLVVLERPEPTLNVFEFVPESWVANRDLVERAAALWQELPYYFQALFNTVFWCGERFKRYCIGQSSIRNHHAFRNGNLQHSIEVAEIMLSLLHLYPDGNRSVAIMAGLLHDAGKADEYHDRGGSSALTNRGKLLGHKITAIEWIAVAREKLRVGIPDASYLSLAHALTATGHSAAYTGLREAQTPEAALLTHADRLSGKAHLAPTSGKQHQSLLPVKPMTFPDERQRRPNRPLAGMEALIESIRAAHISEAQ